MSIGITVMIVNKVRLVVIRLLPFRPKYAHLPCVKILNKSFLRDEYHVGSNTSKRIRRGCSADLGLHISEVRMHTRVYECLGGFRVHFAVSPRTHYYDSYAGISELFKHGTALT